MARYQLRNNNNNNNNNNNMFSCWYPMFYPKGVKVLVSVCSPSSPVEYWQPLETRYKDLRVHIPEL